jgi:farnesyl-diphosphate farnesyltransferase
MFWPHEIWGQYGSSLEDFKQPGNRRAAVQCLNHLVRRDVVLLLLLLLLEL